MKYFKYTQIFLILVLCSVASGQEKKGKNPLVSEKFDPFSSKSAAVMQILPTPGFHLHLKKDGTMELNGTPVNVKEVEEAVNIALNMVCSVCISILITKEKKANFSNKLRQLLTDTAGIQLYVLKEYKLKK